jgi:hypothetical protein
MSIAGGALFLAGMNFVAGTLSADFSSGLAFRVFALVFFAEGAFLAWVVFTPMRRKERKRREDLLESIEALAEKDPNLFIIARLVRDDIAISSRQSGRLSLLQSALFFIAGIVVPYVAQFIAPHVQVWLSQK